MQLFLASPEACCIFIYIEAATLLLLQDLRGHKTAMRTWNCRQGGGSENLHRVVSVGFSLYFKPTFKWHPVNNENTADDLIEY